MSYLKYIINNNYISHSVSGWSIIWARAVLSSSLRDAVLSCSLRAAVLSRSLRAAVLSISLRAAVLSSSLRAAVLWSSLRAAVLSSSLRVAVLYWGQTLETSYDIVFLRCEISPRLVLWFRFK